MSRRACRTTRSFNEDEDDPEITSGDEAEREYEKHAGEPTDSDDVVEEKVATLVELMKTCHTKLIYTGAGISTAANIPDYRGPGGVYTLAKKGIEVTCHDIVSQSPTTSHLVIKELYRHRYISHIVSQNCDGMHLRSGIPQGGLSEIHGNMHIEVCSVCQDRQFIRKFDVTEDSGYRAHTTRRVCLCGAPLLDTIVHYGERGRARFPLNWEAAQELVPVADLIICIGSSLQVLKDYKFLWPAPGSNAKIVIINLQWTPKDADASLVIRGDCEKILTKLAEGLGIEIKHYCRDCDPILTARRNTRNGELLMKMTDCMCHVRAPRTSPDCQKEEKQQYCPGWWRVGMKAICKDAEREMRERRSNTKEDSGYEEQNRDPTTSNTPSPPVNTPRKRGRPRKRKSSAEEEMLPPGRKKTSGTDDDEYAPERHHLRAPTSSLRSTRSSGVVDEHPLIGDFRKKRQDAGRRRVSAEAADSPGLAEEPSTSALTEEAETITEEIEEIVEEVGEEEDVDVEEYEEVIEEVEEVDIDGEEPTAMLDEPLSALEDVPLTSLAESIVHRPFKRRLPQSQDDDEDAFIDVVGDVEDDDDVYEDALRNDPVEESLNFDDPSEAFRDKRSSSLSLSLSQLNGTLNVSGEIGGRLGDRSLGLDVYDFQEDSQQELIGLPTRQRYDAHTASFVPANGYRRTQASRYALDGPGPSTSSYYDDRPLSPSDGSLYEPPFVSANQSMQQLNFVKNGQVASTTATLNVRYQRGPRRKKAPDTNSVEFFLRQINGARAAEAPTSIGAIFEQARQIVNPDDDEQQFQHTLISVVRDQLGVPEPMPPPERKVTKKAKKTSTNPDEITLNSATICAL
ncbi:hypothetical protein PMAYCL1PPCAC_31821 [Pristionchus mayeri]|uniref:Regulatory protein SIR2 homolog 7 n=1 Tax=Pristionchus mayeri TaxID=1317129 RepID=A0AAN5DDR6_9BILA|nr:hypothetical protein PMAYCL1PPCAC_31821 [Pristionchus mayeri]